MVRPRVSHAHGAAVAAFSAVVAVGSSVRADRIPDSKDCVLTITRPAPAGAVEEESVNEPARFRLQYPAFVATSVTDAYVGVRTYAAYQSASVVPFSATKDTLALATLAVVPELSFNPVPPLALYGGTTGSAVAGVNGGTLIARGADLSGGIFLGAIVGILPLDRPKGRFRLSLNGRYTRAWGESILIERLVNAISTNPQNQNFVQGASDLSHGVGQLTVPFDEVQTRLDAAGAYAMSRYFALQFAVGFEYARRSLSPKGGEAAITHTSRVSAPRFGAALGYDPHWSYVPIAIQLEYQVTINQETVIVQGSTPLADAARITDTVVGLGFYYAATAPSPAFDAHPHLALGLVVYRHFGLESTNVYAVGQALASARAGEWGASTVLRYVW